MWKRDQGCFYSRIVRRDGNAACMAQIASLDSTSNHVQSSSLQGFCNAQTGNWARLPAHSSMIVNRFKYPQIASSDCRHRRRHTVKQYLKNFVGWSTVCGGVAEYRSSNRNQTITLQAGFPSMLICTMMSKLREASSLGSVCKPYLRYV